LRLGCPLAWKLEGRGAPIRLSQAAPAEQVSQKGEKKSNETSGGRYRSLLKPKEGGKRHGNTRKILTRPGGVGKVFGDLKKKKKKQTRWFKKSAGIKNNLIQSLKMRGGKEDKIRPLNKGDRSRANFQGKKNNRKGGTFTQLKI